MRSHGQDPRDGDAVFAEVERRTRDLLVADQSVILDATHYRHKYRTYAIELARKLGTRCVAVWLDVPLDIALHRNLRRTGHLYGDLPVTSRVVRSIHRQLEPPEADEVDEVVRVSQFPGRR